MANVPHSTLTGDNLHHNVGDSRSARAWTLAAGTANALLIENSNNNDLLAITTSVTPGSTTIVLGNSTDLPSISLRGTTTIEGPLATSIFTVSTNSGGDVPLRIDTGAAAPHSIRLSESYLQLVELGTGDPTNIANSGLLYTKDAAGVTELYYQASDGTVTALTPPSGGIGGNVGVNDNRVVRSDGIGGVTVQGSVVAIDDTGGVTGVTGYVQASGSHSVTGNGVFTIGDGGTSTISFVPGSGGLTVSMLDNDGGNFRVVQSGDVYIGVDTTNGAEKVTIGGASPATMDVDVFAGDDITIAAGNDALIDIGSLGASATALRIRDGADTAQVYLSVDTTNDTVTIGNSSTGASTVTINSGTGGLNLNIVDNDTAAFTIQQSSNIYFRVRTSNVSETITIGGATNPRIDIGGTGALGRSDAAGADQAGTDMRVRAGAGTGAGTAGVLYLATPSAEASSSTVQTHTDRVMLGGTSTTTTLLVGNPDPDNLVATPVTDVYVRATSGNGAAQGADLLVMAGGNNSTGRGGHLTLGAGFSVGAAAGGDASLVAGDADTGTPGTLRLATLGDVDGVGTDRITIEPSGAVQYVYQGATSMPVHFVERYRYTANQNGAAQDVLTYSVPSGGATWVDVRAVWIGATAADSAFQSLMGACYNNGGTTDEVGGAGFTATGTRAGAALTDTVEIRLTADNAADTINLQLYKIGSTDYQVDVFVTVHRTA